MQQIASIEHMLAQMRAVARSASGATRADTVHAPPDEGFAEALSRSLQRVSTQQNQAAAQARAFELGVPDVSLNDVMIDMQTAGLAFQATVQVRNRLVAAYQEIASMPV